MVTELTRNSFEDFVKDGIVLIDFRQIGVALV